MLAQFPALDTPQAAPKDAFVRRTPAHEARTAGPMPVYHPAAPVRANYADTQGTAPDSPQAPSFSDFLDIINPLQHIPLVNIAYRHVSGDTIGGLAQIIGGALFGGPIGAVAGTASAIAQYQTGRSPADAVISAFGGDSPARTPPRTYVDLSAPIQKRYNFNRTV